MRVMSSPSNDILARARGVPDAIVPKQVFLGVNSIASIPQRTLQKKHPFPIRYTLPARHQTRHIDHEAAQHGKGTTHDA